MGLTIFATILTLPLLLSPLFGFYENQSLDILQKAYSDLYAGTSWPATVIILGALAYHFEYALNFVVVGKLNSVTFSVGDIARRIVIIIIGSFMFSKPLTAMNCMGIAVAVSGVLWYSYLDNYYSSKSSTVKVEEKKDK
jgi:hypothetical protein